MGTNASTADRPTATANPFELRREDVRVAVERYFDFLHDAVASIPTRERYEERLKSYLKSNIEAARDYMLRLGQAKDFEEVLRIQVAFAQAQFNAFSGQATDFAKHMQERRSDAIASQARTSPAQITAA